MKTIIKINSYSYSIHVYMLTLSMGGQPTVSTVLDSVASIGLFSNISSQVDNTLGGLKQNMLWTTQLSFLPGTSLLQAMSISLEIYI